SRQCAQSRLLARQGRKGRPSAVARPSLPAIGFALLSWEGMMRNAAATGSVLAAILFGLSPGSAQTAAPTGDLEKRFDAMINSAEMGGWMKTMASEPNHVGSPHDKANAEMALAQFKSWGWDAHIETFQVLYPTPLSESVELIAPIRFKATLTEAPV